MYNSNISCNQEVHSLEGIVVLDYGGAHARFDKRTGSPIDFTSNNMTVNLSLPLVDIGINGKYIMETLEFQSFLPFATWELPDITPTGSSREWDYIGVELFNSRKLSTFYKCDEINMQVIWEIFSDCLCMSVEFVNNTSKEVWINGVGYCSEFQEGVSFDFPGNLPIGVFDKSNLRNGEIKQTSLMTAITHFTTHSGHLNVMFINPEERWSTAVEYKTQALNLWHIAAVEANLAPQKSLHCGSLYIQPVGTGDHFEALRKFYTLKGWKIPTDGDKDGVIYSCHPSGTMDTHFSRKDTLFDSAEYLYTLKEMGITHIWLLPVFDHADRRCYHPTDQSIIDKRYGGEDGMKHFTKIAHSLGMKVLFDYVPHGPEVKDPLGIAYGKKWGSVKRDGTFQIEWDCLSFDMANPEYLRYTYDLVREHIKRFEIDGARIDCAMGGLSNWKPYGNNRASSSNIKGGVLISHTIRKAFVDSGVKPFVTPENFHPIPLYYSSTDAYYGMALYQVLYHLNGMKIEAKEFVKELTIWLEAENKSNAEGLVRMRFLGNHDTVSWVWDAKRPAKVYGIDKVRAMWVLLSLIDGMPMIYQGDENPEIYFEEGMNLIDFFSGLFKAKHKYTNASYSTEYLYTGTAIFAFFRIEERARRLILINFDNAISSFSSSFELGRILYGSASIKNNVVELNAYEYVMFDLPREV